MPSPPMDQRLLIARAACLEVGLNPDRLYIEVHPRSGKHFIAIRGVPLHLATLYFKAMLLSRAAGLDRDDPDWNSPAYCVLHGSHWRTRITPCGSLRELLVTPSRCPSTQEPYP